LLYTLPFIVPPPPPPTPPPFPYTTLFRSSARIPPHFPNDAQTRLLVREGVTMPLVRILSLIAIVEGFGGEVLRTLPIPPNPSTIDRKSTRLNSSHVSISYAVFCLKKKKKR